MVFQKPGGVSAAIVLKGPLVVSTESHPVKSGIHSQYCTVLGTWFPPGLAGEALWAVLLGPLTLRVACGRLSSGWAEGTALLATTGTFLSI